LFEEKAMGLPRRDIEYHTYADYCSWPDDVRYELIDGVAYAMGPAPVRRHQGILLELARQVANVLEGSPCRPYIAPFDVRLPKAGEIDDDVNTVVQPDLVVICDRAKLDDKGCRGAPDWVVEVLSPSTAGHDQILKRALYQRVGVREYWLVHPVDRLVTIYTLNAGSYGVPDVRELVGTLPVGVLPEIVIDWARVVRELDD
jgi:Uma2 family endonuclease